MIYYDNLCKYESCMEQNSALFGSIFDFLKHFCFPGKLIVLTVHLAKVSFKFFCWMDHAVIHGVELYRSHQTSFFEENMMSHIQPNVMCQSTCEVMPEMW